MVSVDKSYGHTDEKEYQNLMAMTADGALKGRMTATATYNLASLADGAGATTTVTVNGAARGRFLFNRIIKDELVSKMQFPFYQNGECPPWLGMYGYSQLQQLKTVVHHFLISP